MRLYWNELGMGKGKTRGKLNKVNAVTRKVKIMIMLMMPVRIEG